MTPERWKQIEKIYQAAREGEPKERSAFLNQACAGDAALRHEVESLLAREQSAESFMEAPAMEATIQGSLKKSLVHAGTADRLLQDSLPPGCRRHGTSVSRPG